VHGFTFELIEIKILIATMVGQLAYRGQYGLILPSTNTSVEAEFNAMIVPGTHAFETFGPIIQVIHIP
jgi:hypothetical protein